jgi:zinc D-Ala-D-Ala carboxypeptidase
MENIQFTKDFDLIKLTHSDTATRNHIVEQFMPVESVRENLKALAINILQPLRDALGDDFFISCAFRCPAVNKSVGGAETSQHLTGQASDNIYPKGNLYLAKTVLTHNLPFDQMILEGGTLVKPNWIHLSYSPRNRREILRADFSSGKAVYSVLTKQQVINQ